MKTIEYFATDEGCAEGPETAIESRLVVLERENTDLRKSLELFRKVNDYQENTLNMFNQVFDDNRVIKDNSPVERLRHFLKMAAEEVSAVQKGFDRYMAPATFLEWVVRYVESNPNADLKFCPFTTKKAVGSTTFGEIKGWAARIQDKKAEAK